MGQSLNLNLEQITPGDLAFSARKGQVVIRGKCGQRFRIERKDVPVLIELLQAAVDWAEDQYKASPRLQMAEQQRQLHQQALRQVAYNHDPFGGYYKEAEKL